MTVLLMVIVAAFGLAVFDAWAQTTTTRGGPFDLALIGTYAWVTAIAALGGIASFHRRVQSGQSRWINLTELLGELFTSSLAGLLTYWGCRSADINEWLAAAFIGMAGHMGSRALFAFEKFLAAKVWQPTSRATREWDKFQERQQRGSPGDER